MSFVLVLALYPILFFVILFSFFLSFSQESTPADLHALAAEQNALQAATEAELLRMKHAPKDTGIETCQAYLQEVRIEEEWDCESILSTYSTLDNHPTVIKVQHWTFSVFISAELGVEDGSTALLSSSVPKQHFTYTICFIFSLLNTPATGHKLEVPQVPLSSPAPA